VSCVPHSDQSIAIATSNLHPQHFNDFNHGVTTHYKYQAITIAICGFFWFNFGAFEHCYHVV
jgi:hypothetical protein